MTTYKLLAELLQTATDIRFLAENARCPALTRTILDEWTAKILREEEGAIHPKVLSSVLDALVTLSHSNAAFSRSVVPVNIERKSSLDVADSGGYFASRKAIAALIRISPISDDDRLILARQVLDRIDLDERTLEHLIPS